MARRHYRLNDIFPRLRCAQGNTIEQLESAASAMLDALIDDGVITPDEALPILRDVERARRSAACNSSVLGEMDDLDFERGMELAMRELDRQDEARRKH